MLELFASFLFQDKKEEPVWLEDINQFDLGKDNFSAGPIYLCEKLLYWISAEDFLLKTIFKGILNNASF